MDDQYCIKKNWPHCVPRLPLACRLASRMQGILYVRLKTGYNTVSGPAWITR